MLSEEPIKWIKRFGVCGLQGDRNDITLDNTVNNTNKTVADNDKRRQKRQYGQKTWTFNLLYQNVAINLSQKLYLELGTKPNINWTNQNKIVWVNIIFREKKNGPIKIGRKTKRPPTKNRYRYYNGMLYNIVGHLLVNNDDLNMIKLTT